MSPTWRARMRSSLNRVGSTGRTAIRRHRARRPNHSLLTRSNKRWILGVIILVIYSGSFRQIVAASAASQPPHSRRRFSAWTSKSSRCRVLREHFTLCQKISCWEQLRAMTELQKRRSWDCQVILRSSSIVSAHSALSPALSAPSQSQPKSKPYPHPLPLPYDIL